MIKVLRNKRVAISELGDQWLRTVHFSRTIILFYTFVISNHYEL